MYTGTNVQLLKINQIVNESKDILTKEGKTVIRFFVCPEEIFKYLKKFLGTVINNKKSDIVMKDNRLYNKPEHLISAN